MITCNIITALPQCDHSALKDTKTLSSPLYNRRAATLSLSMLKNRRSVEFKTMYITRTQRAPRRSAIRLDAAGTL